MRDTYGDMEDEVNTNAGMRLEAAQHDFKICQKAGMMKKQKTLDFICNRTTYT